MGRAGGGEGVVRLRVIDRGGGSSCRCQMGGVGRGGGVSVGMRKCYNYVQLMTVLLSLYLLGGSRPQYDQSSKKVVVRIFASPLGKNLMC